MKGLNVHLYFSPIIHETRILKETKSLTNHGQITQILILGVFKDGLIPEEELDATRQISRISLTSKLILGRFSPRFLEFIEWCLRVLAIPQVRKANFISCHSLSVLPLGLALKVLSKGKLIYETHELETERHGWSGIKKFIAKCLERLLIPFVDSTVVVGKSIQNWYSGTYGRDNIYLVRNIPNEEFRAKSSSHRLRSTLKISDADFVFIYQGILNKGRNIEMLCQVFSELPKEKHLVFLGHGPLEDYVRNITAQYSNIHFHPSVPLEELCEITSGADIGLALFPDTCLSYRYSSPNKLFEYLLSGIPAVVSDFPDMAEIIDNFDCGWKVSPNKREVLNVLESINRGDLEKKKIGVTSASQLLSWENEEEQLIAAYN